MPQAPASLQSANPPATEPRAFLAVAAWSYATSQAKGTSGGGVVDKSHVVGDPISGLLSFVEGEDMQVLRWSKSGWWWCCHLPSGDQGWVSSAYLQPREAALPPRPWPTEEGGEIVQDAVSCETGSDVIDDNASIGEVPTDERESELEVSSAVWPPLPFGPRPDGSADMREQDERFDEIVEPVWPPLPPGPAPPRNDSRHDQEVNSAAPAEESQEYQQTLGFRRNGFIRAAVVPAVDAWTDVSEVANGTRLPGEPLDRSSRQLHHYFDYQAWSDKANAESRLRDANDEPVKRMGDGGIKRRRLQ